MALKELKQKMMLETAQQGIEQNMIQQHMQQQIDLAYTKNIANVKFKNGIIEVATDGLQEVIEEE